MSEQATAAAAEISGIEGEGPRLQHGFAGRRPGWDIPPLHSGLELTSVEPLAQLPSRITCQKCGRNRLYFCYDCLRPFTSTPEVALPFGHLYIVTHPAQSWANATGVHLALLARAQASLCPLEEIPDNVFSDPGTVVLYPDDAAVRSSTFRQTILVQQVGAEDLAASPVPVTNVIVVDSLWGHSKAIMRDAKMEGVRHVRIRSYRTSFWRFHTKGVPSDGLCTVEAVYFLCKELHAGAGIHADCHCFDDLLWYFAFMHRKIYRESRGRLFDVRPPGQMTACVKDGVRGSTVRTAASSLLEAAPSASREERRRNEEDEGREGCVDDTTAEEVASQPCER